MLDSPLRYMTPSFFAWQRGQQLLHRTPINPAPSAPQFEFEDQVVGIPKYVKHSCFPRRMSFLVHPVPIDGDPFCYFHMLSLLNFYS